MRVCVRRMRVVCSPPILPTCFLTSYPWPLACSPPILAHLLSFPTCLPAYSCVFSLHPRRHKKLQAGQGQAEREGSGEGPTPLLYTYCSLAGTVRRSGHGKVGAMVGRGYGRGGYGWGGGVTWEVIESDSKLPVWKLLRHLPLPLAARRSSINFSRPLWLRL